MAYGQIYLSSLLESDGGAILACLGDIRATITWLYRLFADRKSSYCVAQCPGANLRKWAPPSRLRFGVFLRV